MKMNRPILVLISLLGMLSSSSGDAPAYSLFLYTRNLPDSRLSKLSVDLMEVINPFFVAVPNATFTSPGASIESAPVGDNNDTDWTDSSDEIPSNSTEAPLENATRFLRGSERSLGTINTCPKNCKTKQTKRCIQLGCVSGNGYSSGDTVVDQLVDAVDDTEIVDILVNTNVTRRTRDRDLWGGGGGWGQWSQRDRERPLPSKAVYGIEIAMNYLVWRNGYCRGILFCRIEIDLVLLTPSV